VGQQGLVQGAADLVQLGQAVQQLQATQQQLLR
jgi:hypothetical protein